MLEITKYVSFAAADLKKKATQKSGIEMHQTSYPQNNVPMNQQYFDNPQTLTLTNKYDSTERA